MFDRYFEDCEVKDIFAKEFVSIFDGWLGGERLYKLNEVTEDEWGRFNALVVLISKRYALQVASCEDRACIPVTNVNSIIQTHAEAMEKDPSQFLKLVIPELDCVFTEEWDYTYILWHTGNGALEVLAPLIRAVGLHHFHE